MKPPASSGLPPVLCYHRIGGPLELGVTRVARSVFARQMTTLARSGWRTLSLTQFAQRVQRGVVAAGDEVLLTFDDGYESLADEAYPLLADLGFTATTFLVTDYVGQLNGWDVRYTRQRLRHLDWTTVEHWHQRGFDFGSHSASHARLTWLSDADAAAQLAGSRATLVARLGPGAGQAVAYPFGALDERVQRLAAAAGYQLGFGGVRGSASSLNVPRIPVYGWDVGAVPWGLRQDRLGTVARFAAYAANRCAVGTSVIKRLGLGNRGWGAQCEPPSP